MQFSASSIVGQIVEAFTGLLSGVAASIVSLFQTLFMNATVSEGVTTYSGISSFGIWTLAFIGVGAAMAIVHAIRGKVLK